MDSERKKDNILIFPKKKNLEEILLPKILFNNNSINSIQEISKFRIKSYLDSFKIIYEKNDIEKKFEIFNTLTQIIKDGPKGHQYYFTFSKEGKSYGIFPRYMFLGFEYLNNDVDPKFRFLIDNFANNNSYNFHIFTEKYTQNKFLTISGFEEEKRKGKLKFLEISKKYYTHRGFSNSFVIFQKEIEGFTLWTKIS